MGETEGLLQPRGAEDGRMLLEGCGCWALVQTFKSCPSG